MLAQRGRPGQLPACRPLLHAATVHAGSLRSCWAEGWWHPLARRSCSRGSLLPLSLSPLTPLSPHPRVCLPPPPPPDGSLLLTSEELVRPENAYDDFSRLTAQTATREGPEGEWGPKGGRTGRGAGGGGSACGVRARRSAEVGCSLPISDRRLLPSPPLLPPPQATPRGSTSRSPTRSPCAARSRWRSSAAPTCWAWRRCGGPTGTRGRGGRAERGRCRPLLHPPAPPPPCPPPMHAPHPHAPCPARRVGRTDNPTANPAGKLAPAGMNTTEFEAFFTTRGLTLAEGLALMGSHALLDEQACFRWAGGAAMQRATSWAGGAAAHAGRPAAAPGAAAWLPVGRAAPRPAARASRAPTQGLTARPAPPRPLLPCPLRRGRSGNVQDYCDPSAERCSDVRMFSAKGARYFTDLWVAGCQFHHEGSLKSIRKLKKLY